MWGATIGTRQNIAAGYAPPPRLPPSRLGGNMPCLPPSRSFFLSLSAFLPSFARSPHSLTLSLTLRRSHDGRSALGSGAGGWTDATERRTHARTDKLTPPSSSALPLSRSFGSCSCVAPSLLLLLAPFRQPDRHPASAKATDGDGGGSSPIGEKGQCDDARCRLGGRRRPSPCYGRKGTDLQRGC